MAKKVPTRAVPTSLSPEARSFVMQGQLAPEAARPSVPPPPPEPAVTPAPTLVPVAVQPAPLPAPAPAPTAAPAPAPSPAAATAPAAARGRKRGARALISRVDGRTLRRLQIYLDADVAKRLKLHCVEHDIDMSAYVNDVLARALR